MTTAAQVITRARRSLLAGVKEERNALSSGIDASTTTIPLSYELGGLRGGVSIEIDSELLTVWSATGATASAQRAVDGTTAASHTSGTVITVGPRFPRAILLDFLNAELHDLSSPDAGLFRVAQVELSYNGEDRAIDLTGITDIIDILDVRWRYTGTDWPAIRRWSLVRNADPTDFPSGFALVLHETPAEGTIQVVYKRGFSTVTESQDLTTDAGLPASAIDIVELGIQLNALIGREAKRNFIESQGDTRRAQEVDAGAMQAAWRGIAARRQQRIQAEHARLLRTYPTRARR